MHYNQSPSRALRTRLQHRELVALHVQREEVDVAHTDGVQHRSEGEAIRLDGIDVAGRGRGAHIWMRRSVGNSRLGVRARCVVVNMMETSQTQLVDELYVARLVVGSIDLTPSGVLL